ncbi:hypothetical protein MVEN_01169000 [Mycena venus]|uniref:Uncharacterized protein n=1 Tax=Mycena venus TaxID=2733690 RepID=A0A8H7CYH0_9AGAR|nr:hypothetical protein MVEN_01169000 [Mycena venus]
MLLGALSPTTDFCPLRHTLAVRVHSARHRALVVSSQSAHTLFQTSTSSVAPCACAQELAALVRKPPDSSIPGLWSPPCRSARKSRAVAPMPNILTTTYSRADADAAANGEDEGGDCDATSRLGNEMGKGGKEKLRYEYEREREAGLQCAIYHSSFVLWRLHAPAHVNPLAIAWLPSPSPDPLSALPLHVRLSPPAPSLRTPTSGEPHDRHVVEFLPELDGYGGASPTRPTNPRLAEVAERKGTLRLLPTIVEDAPPLLVSPISYSSDSSSSSPFHGHLPLSTIVGKLCTTDCAGPILADSLFASPLPRFLCPFGGLTTVT